MAFITENTAAGNGTLTTFSFTFPYIEESDVYVSLKLDSTKEVTELTRTTDWTFANATTISFNTIGAATDWQETTGAPKTGVTVRVYRDTNIDSAQATFFAGSAIRAQDLNDNNNQVLYSTQETVDRRVNNDGDTMTGDLTLQAANIVFEGSTVDDYETTLTAVDPTADRTITLPDVTGTVVTTGDTGTVATAMIAADAVNGSKIADDSIDSEHYVDGSIDTQHIADSQITTAKIANSNVTTAKIADSNVTTAKIADSNVTTAKIADANVTTAKIADSNVTGAKIADNTITSAKLTGATVVTASEQSGATVNDTSFFTTAASDGRYFRQDSTETIASGDTWTGSDAYVATTGAIDARIIDLVDDVGGFVPIANETSFPTANPDVNNGAGTIVSVAAIATTRTPAGGIVTIPNGSGSNTVTITGCGSTDLESGYGMLVETTTTLHTYTFHRLVPKATEVTTVAGIAADITTAAANVADISNFADVYQISASGDPTQRTDSSALQTGDLVYRGDLSVIRAYNGSEYQNITPDAATLADISIVADDLASFEDLGLITDSLVAAQSGGALETCADNIADIRTLADIEDGTEATNAIQTVAGNSANVTTVAGSIANVNTVAVNISDVNNFADLYTISSTQPASASSGDLWYDSTANTLKFYDGATWNSISAGISALVDDTTPQLGGALDGQDNNLNNIGTIDGTNLQIDFGTI